MELYRLRNYNSLLSITLAITSHNITRIKYIWKELSKKYVVNVEFLSELCSPKHNFDKLREEMNKSIGIKRIIPCIPCYLKDLSLVEIGNKDEEVRNELRTPIVMGLAQMKAFKYNFTAFYNIQSWISMLILRNSFTAEKIAQLSDLVLEEIRLKENEEERTKHQKENEKAKLKLEKQKEKELKAKLKETANESIKLRNSGSFNEHKTKLQPSLDFVEKAKFDTVLVKSTNNAVTNPRAAEPVAEKRPNAKVRSRSKSVKLTRRKSITFFSNVKKKKHSNPNILSNTITTNDKQTESSSKAEKPRPVSNSVIDLIAELKTEIKSDASPTTTARRRNDNLKMKKRKKALSITTTTEVSCKSMPTSYDVQKLSRVYEALIIKLESSKLLAASLLDSSPSKLKQVTDVYNSNLEYLETQKNLIANILDNESNETIDIPSTSKVTTNVNPSNANSNKQAAKQHAADDSTTANGEIILESSISDNLHESTEDEKEDNNNNDSSATGKEKGKHKRQLNLSDGLSLPINGMLINTSAASSTSPKPPLHTRELL